MSGTCIPSLKWLLTSSSVSLAAPACLYFVCYWKELSCSLCLAVGVMFHVSDVTSNTVKIAQTTCLCLSSLILTLMLQRSLTHFNHFLEHLGQSHTMDHRYGCSHKSPEWLGHV